MAGPSSIIAWLFALASASCVAYSLAKAAYKYPSTGAFYSIFSVVFNKKISLIIVFLYLISVVVGIAAIADGIGQYFSFFGFQYTPFSILLVEVIAILAFCTINVRGVTISGKTENVLTIAKIAPLIILSLILIPYIHLSNFFPFYPSSGITSFLKALVIVYFPFTGFEISAIPAQETKTTEKIVYRSMRLTLIIVGFIYIFLNISLIGATGSYVLANSPAPLATASGLISKESEYITAIIGIIAMLSAVNAYMLAASRVLQNVSSLFSLHKIRDISSRGTPANATILVALAACALVVFLSHNFELLASISVIATLVTYIFVCICAYKIFSNITIRIVACIGMLLTSTILVIYFPMTIQ
jgi:amino acid transporter